MVAGQSVYALGRKVMEQVVSVIAHLEYCELSIVGNLRVKFLQETLCHLQE